MLSVGDLRLRASWSQGFKTPTLKELNYRYIREMTSIVMYMGNKDLKAQTSNYYSLNAEYTWGGLNLTVTGYLNQVDRMITLVTVPRTEAPAEYRQQYGEMLGKVRRYENMEDARTSGVDANMRYVHGQFTAGLGYSYLDTDAHVYDADHDRLVKVTIDGMAHHKGNVFVTWEKNTPVSARERSRMLQTVSKGVGLYGRFSSRRYYQLDGDGKGYQIWRLSAHGQFSLSRIPSLGVGLEAGIDNIFNYCDRTPHGLHLGTTTPGRTVYATLTLQLKKGTAKDTRFTSSNNKSKSNLNTKQNDEEQD